MTIRLNHFLAFLIGSWLAAASLAVWAMEPKNITPAEIAALPRFCPDTQTFKEGVDFSDRSPSTRKWLAVLGKHFWHIHHYCWALINIHRAARASTPAKEKLALHLEARGDLGYFLSKADADFVLLPEILTWSGRVHLLLNEPKQASEAFAKARSLKPDYWPPFFHWAQFLHTKGKNAEAMEIVRTGLQYSPEAKPLLLLYRDLGGKPADIPQPIAIAKPDDPAQASTDQQGQGSPVPDSVPHK